MNICWVSLLIIGLAMAACSSASISLKRGTAVGLQPQKDRIVLGRGDKGSETAES
jgi:hypothetical protein